MIFISHTSKDKSLVEPIATTLAKVFGADKVFYDSWSIQPGDGIIDKMNQGLSECKFFFFFVSKNSLESQMVKLEWQNALYKATNGDVKIIPVKLDDCSMPVILMQNLYIDINGTGLDNAVRQMIDVINGNNTFTSFNRTYENVRAYIEEISNSEMKIELRAETYLEPISRYLILINNEKSEVNCMCENEGMVIKNFYKDLTLNNGIKCNGCFISVSRATSPGFPLKIRLTSTNKISFVGVMRAVSDSEFRAVPCVINTINKII